MPASFLLHVVRVLSYKCLARLCAERRRVATVSMGARHRTAELPRAATGLGVHAAPIHPRVAECLCLCALCYALFVYDACCGVLPRVRCWHVAESGCCVGV